MFLFQKIEETMMRYTDARHAVGEFILQEQDKLYQYTVTEIAEKTFTSKATVVRFAKAMGYDGWKEFMKGLHCRGELPEKSIKIQLILIYRFRKRDGIDTIAENIKNCRWRVFVRRQICWIKRGAEKGRGLSGRSRKYRDLQQQSQYIPRELFKRKLLTIGKRAAVAKSGEAGIEAATLGPQDLALIISYSGNSVTQNPVNQESGFSRKTCANHRNYKRGR